jgi:hypothetical protein
MRVPTDIQPTDRRINKQGQRHPTSPFVDRLNPPRAGFLSAATPARERRSVATE